jgi:hypothetical protein
MRTQKRVKTDIFSGTNGNGFKLKIISRISNCDFELQQKILFFSETVRKEIAMWSKSKGINRKQSTRWQHLSQLKASAFFSLQKKFSCYETQQLILGTGTAIWWLTEPHLEHQKVFVFDWKVSFTVLMKCGINFGPFASTVINEMKSRGILCSKRHHFQS